MTRAMLRAVAKLLLRWFAVHGRELPWRKKPRDPYHVWLAEVMLQQTQVATAIPYYERWLGALPTIASLAAAPLDAVLKLWEGLGYYARARNLHRAAIIIQAELNGRLPDTIAGLLQLPGIGTYTAAAVASLAFDRDAAALDGNIKRVMTRVHGLREPANRDVLELCEASLPRGRAGEFNEALMDLGATVCTPRAPNCAACPLRACCAAHASGAPEQFAPPKKRAAVPHKHFITLVAISTKKKWLMAQRPTDGLLGGLWEFPGIEVHGDAVFNTAHLAALRGSVRTQTGVLVDVSRAVLVGTVKHAFTHFKLTRQVALAQRVHERACTGAARWVNERDITALALTRSDLRIRELVLNHTGG